MNDLFPIGQPVSEPETVLSQHLGSQGATMLKLAERGVDFLPGILVAISTLYEDFEKVVSIILQQGLAGIETSVRPDSAKNQPPLDLLVSLLPDVAIEANPEEVVPGETPARLRKCIEELVDTYRSDLLNQSLPAAVLIQYLPDGRKDNSCTTGCFLNRDPLSGKLLPSGQFESHCDPGAEGISRLQESATILESWYLDIRQIDFVMDGGRIWVTGQSTGSRTVQAQLKLLTDLFNQGGISDITYINALSPETLSTLFYPRTDPAATADLKSIKGGVAGSPGAGTGKVFFSPEKLKAAYWQAKSENQDPNLILLKESTHADDLEAIRLSQGVITSRGGYTSHAPIVARYLGKPSLIYHGIEHFEKHVDIEGQLIQEGQTLTIDIQPGAPPILFIGTADIQSASHDSTDLYTLLEQSRMHCHRTQVRANADTVQEARLALHYKASGIGLCRTEHLFMDDEILETLQSLIINEDAQQKPLLLSKLDTFLSNAFLEFFRIMDGQPLAIRLLDAPLHEFFVNPATPERIKNRLKQANPMLGLRGCRLGISMPELYDMQVHAILTAALEAHLKENISVHPDILIPFVISHREISVIKKGQATAEHASGGIESVIREAVKSAGLETLPFELRIGAVIETPAAALSTAAMVHQVEIISFGTNDLTQMTLGLSRDDIGSMVQTYEELNIWEDDPFQSLAEPVKHLIEHSVRSGKAVRPDLEIGMCGEAGASREVIRFAVQLGLDYISCAARSVPMVLLAAAQIQISEQDR